MYLKGFWNFISMPNDSTSGAFYVFKVLAKRQGLLVLWPHVTAQYLLMSPFCLWLLYFSFLIWFFPPPPVLHITNSFFSLCIFFKALFHRPPPWCPHVFFASLFFMFFFCAFCLFWFLLLEKTLSDIFLFIVLFFFVGRSQLIYYWSEFCLRGL